MNKIKVIGAGLAGCEATLQLVKAGYEVDLYEMRPSVMTPAHQTGLFAELVCSNSLKSMLLTTSSGLLKAELDILGCELLALARECVVPAGNALAVDRIMFGEAVTERIKASGQVNLFCDEVVCFADCDTILATGPLTSDNLTRSLLKIIGNEHLYFFDAIAPIVSADSINMDRAFTQTRYDAGEADYLNCPFSKDEYYRFVEALANGEKHQAKEFESDFFSQIDFKYYENCTPIEELARRGADTLRYGVLKPVGLTDPHTQRRPFAVLQLRTENADKTAYNLVGCQTMLKYGAQKSIFRLIPGLENAEFLRYGSIHRNTYLNTPQICNADFSLKAAPHIRLAGQITGVEGYVESIFSGLLTAGILTGQIKSLPPETIVGQLWRYLTTPNKNFTPMNANFGLLPEIALEKRDKRLKKERLSERSLGELGVKNIR